MTRTVQALHIDWTRCDGHGACAELLPELLAEDEWGFPVSRRPDRDPEVPAALLPQAARALKACPMMALHLTVRTSRS